MTELGITPDVVHVKPFVGTNTFSYDEAARALAVEALKITEKYNATH
jgi:hypothetical protein